MTATNPSVQVVEELDRCLTEDEVYELLQLGKKPAKDRKQQMYRLRRDKGLPYTVVAGLRRYSHKKVMEWLRDNSTTYEVST